MNNFFISILALIILIIIIFNTYSYNCQSPYKVSRKLPEPIKKKKSKNELRKLRLEEFENFEKDYQHFSFSSDSDSFLSSDSFDSILSNSDDFSQHLLNNGSAKSSSIKDPLINKKKNLKINNLVNIVKQIDNSLQKNMKFNDITGFDNKNYYILDSNYLSSNQKTKKIRLKDFPLLFDIQGNLLDNTYTNIENFNNKNKCQSLSLKEVEIPCQEKLMTSNEENIICEECIDNSDQIKSALPIIKDDYKKYYQESECPNNYPEEDDNYVRNLGSEVKEIPIEINSTEEESKHKPNSEAPQSEFIKYSKEEYEGTDFVYGKNEKIKDLNRLN